MSIEIEKKYRLTSVQWDRIIASLDEIGAAFVGEDFEENIILSNAELSRKHAVVRIRKTESATTLTFKQRLPSDSTAKHQVEFETKIENADSAISILKGLGLTPAVVYEKKRKTYKLRNAELVLDELPFGLFMEIEGSLLAIAEVEMLLGIEDLKVELNTYPKLTVELGEKNGEITEARFVRN